LSKKYLLKNALLIIFIFSNAIATATDYYISSSGNDSNNGLSSTTPWKTIAKVNSSFSIVKSGDKILFKRGEIFYGTLKVTKSGSSGNPIIIGAYGTGDNPIITGFTTISGWTNEGNGIYSKALASESSSNNIVTVNGVNTPMGRWPNNGYRTYESHTGNASLTDNELSETPNWQGAELVLRKSEWSLERSIITNHNGNTITFATSSSGDFNDGFGYFIQNDIKTLDALGEWYYNGSTFFMYFGGNNPADYDIRMSTLNELIKSGATYPTLFNYITLENITLEGSSLMALYTSQKSDHWTIQNCSFNFHGKYGIFEVQNSYLSIKNNTFDNINNNAIRTEWNGDHLLISNNIISNTGILPGMGISDDFSYDAIVLQENGTAIAEYNTIEHVGHHGIRMNNSGYLIQNNLITDYGIVKGDVGAIYTSNASSITISNNIILNSNFPEEGIGTNNTPWVQGIYIDDYSHDIKISGNTIYNVAVYGLGIQSAQNIEVFDNTVYACNYSQFIIRSFNSSTPVTGINVHDNIFFAKTAGSASFPYTPLASEFMTTLGDINTWGTFDNNYYCRPINDNVIRRYDYVLPDPWNGVGLTLSQWQAWSNYDVNSHKAPIALSDTANIDFFYNATSANKVISLSKPMIDVRGTKYFNTITLLPFTSSVLMVDPNPAQPIIPVYTGSVIENITPSLLEITFNEDLINIVPAPSAFKVLVNSVSRNVNTVIISGTKVRLTLSSPAVSGDAITVSYTKPSSNPLQTSSGEQVASFIPQAVTNKVIAPSLPFYVSSAIENITPSLLEITYNVNLANIIPPSSAFTVQVNSVGRNVSSVNISGIKILLTLSSPVVYGDVVTVSYTKPSTNPLQTTTGEQSASFLPQTVINRVILPNLPIYVSSSIENITPSILEITYNVNLANIVPTSASFMVKVNSVSRPINAVAISGTKVLITLSSPVENSNIVTISYTKPVTNPLQTASGMQAASFSAQPVTNKINPPGSPPLYVSSIIENLTPNLLEMTYNEVLDPTVPGVSAFVVTVNKLNREITSVSISVNKVILTLAKPIVYGDVVTVLYIQPANNQLKKVTGETAASFNFPQPVTNNLAFNSIEKGSIFIYPNPAREFINVSHLDVSSEPKIIRIFDLAGRLCSETIVNPFISDIRVLFNLRAGTYLVHIATNSLILFTQKLIVVNH
jgi:uncharacterized repeat protein (TIGR02059 family)